MAKKIKSILEELDNLYIEKDARHLIESRADNIITSAIRLLESIDGSFPPDQAELLNRKFLNAIRVRDVRKFSKSIRNSNENQ